MFERFLPKVSVFLIFIKKYEQEKITKKRPIYRVDLHKKSRDNSVDFNF